MIRYKPVLVQRNRCGRNFADLFQPSGLAYRLVPVHECRFFLLVPAYQFRQGQNQEGGHMNYAPASSGQSAAYAVVTSIANPCGDFKYGGH